MTVVDKDLKVVSYNIHEKFKAYHRSFFQITLCNKNYLKNGKYIMYNGY